MRRFDNQEYTLKLEVAYGNGQSACQGNQLSEYADRTLSDGLRDCLCHESFPEFF